MTLENIAWLHVMRPKEVAKNLLDHLVSLIAVLVDLELQLLVSGL